MDRVVAEIPGAGLVVGVAQDKLMLLAGVLKWTAPASLQRSAPLGKSEFHVHGDLICGYKPGPLSRQAPSLGLGSPRVNDYAGLANVEGRSAVLKICKTCSHPNFTTICQMSSLHSLQSSCGVSPDLLL